MNQNTSIYWKDKETGRRAKWMAEAEDLSLSAFISTLINERYDRLHPEPPIIADCVVCEGESEFVFLAYWAEQSDLYQCTVCGNVRQRDSLNNGHKADEKAKKEAISNE